MLTQALSRKQINWNQVFYFSEIAACGSIKEAARRLELSPSTLSEHIAQLEKELSIRLFNRLHRKLVLTDEGGRLFQHAKQMFETGQRLIDEVSPIPLGSYPVSVGLVPGSSLPIAYSFLDQYLEGHPSISMKLYHSRHEELEKGLSEARFDFGFSDRPPERKDVTSRLVSSSQLQFYVSPKQAARKLSDLLSELPLLICNAEGGRRSPTEDFLEELGLTPSAVITSDYPSLLLDLCRNGRGVCLYNEEALKRLEKNGLRTLRIPKSGAKMVDRLYALWAKGAENSASVERLKDLWKS